LQRATAAALAWDLRGGNARAQILDKAAELFERDRTRLIAVMVREAGKTLENALADLREAVDFLRYYALQARRLFREGLRPQGIVVGQAIDALRESKPIIRRDVAHRVLVRHARHHRGRQGPLHTMQQFAMSATGLVTAGAAVVSEHRLPSVPGLVLKYFSQSSVPPFHPPTRGKPALRSAEARSA